MLADRFLNTNRAANSTARPAALFEHVASTNVTWTIQVLWHMTTCVSISGTATAKIGSRVEKQELTCEW